MKKFFINAGMLLAFLPAYAQEDTTSKLLDSLVLTSQRTVQQLHLVPYSVDVLKQEVLQDFGTRTSPEALMLVNGVFVQKTNHGGGSPFLRGLTGNQTLTLVDGVRLNNSTFCYGPNQYLNTIDPYSIQKMEVAKGKGSVQYGSDALGGVIQVFTKEPVFSTGKHWRGKMTGKYMSGGMEKTVQGEAAYSAQQFAAQMGATYRHFGDLIGGDTTGKQSPSGYKELALDVKTKFLLQPHLQLTLAHQFLRQQDVAVFHKIKLENYALNEMSPQQRALTYAKLNWSSTNSLFRDINIIASLQNNLEQRNSRKNNSKEWRRERDKVNTFGLTADVFSSILSWWTANSGIELYRDKVYSTREDGNTDTDSKTINRGLYPDGSGYGNYSVFSLHHFQLNRFHVEAGLRYNTFSIHITDTSLGKVSLQP